MKTTEHCVLFICILIRFFLIQDYVVPPEYLYTFRDSMLKRCPVSSYHQVCNVFLKELGRLPDDVCSLNSFIKWCIFFYCLSK